MKAWLGWGNQQESFLVQVSPGKLFLQNHSWDENEEPRRTFLWCKVMSQSLRQMLIFYFSGSPLRWEESWACQWTHYDRSAFAFNLPTTLSEWWGKYLNDVSPYYHDLCSDCVKWQCGNEQDYQIWANQEKWSSATGWKIMSMHFTEMYGDWLNHWW